MWVWQEGPEQWNSRVSQGSPRETFSAHSPALTPWISPMVSRDLHSVKSVASLTFTGLQGVVCNQLTGVIQDVLDGPARNAGVQVGWRIIEIDGEPYNDEVMRRKIASMIPYTLTFEAPGSALAASPHHAMLPAAAAHGASAPAAWGQQLLRAPPGEVAMPPVLLARINQVISQIEGGLSEISSPNGLGTHPGQEDAFMTPRPQSSDNNRLQPASPLPPYGLPGWTGQDAVALTGLGRPGAVMPQSPTAREHQSIEQERMLIQRQMQILHDQCAKLEDLHKMMVRKGRELDHQNNDQELQRLRRREKLLTGELAEAEAVTATAVRHRRLAEEARAKQATMDMARIEELEQQLSNTRIEVYTAEAKTRQGEADLARIAELERELRMRNSIGGATATGISSFHGSSPTRDYHVPPSDDSSREAELEQLNRTYLKRIAELEQDLAESHAVEVRRNDALEDTKAELRDVHAAQEATERRLGATWDELHASRFDADQPTGRVRAHTEAIHPAHSHHAMRQHSQHHPHHVMTKRRHSALGGAGHHPEHTRTAEAVYRQAAEEKQSRLGPEHPETLADVTRLADVLQEAGRLSEAEALYRRALQGNQKVLGSEHPTTLTDMSSLAQLLKSRGKTQEAETLYRRALQGRETRLGETHPDTLMSMWNLGQLLKEHGDSDEAEGLFRRELAGRQASLGPDHEKAMGRMAHLEAFLEQRGKLQEVAELKLAHGQRSTRARRRSTNRRVSHAQETCELHDEPYAAHQNHRSSVAPEHMDGYLGHKSHRNSHVNDVHHHDDVTHLPSQRSSMAHANHWNSISQESDLFADDLEVTSDVPDAYAPSHEEHIAHGPSVSSHPAKVGEEPLPLQHHNHSRHASFRPSVSSTRGSEAEDHHTGSHNVSRTHDFNDDDYLEAHYRSLQQPGLHHTPEIHPTE